MYAQRATSPAAAVRNLAYLHNDLADPALRRHLLRLSRTARTWYERQLRETGCAGDIDARAGYYRELRKAFAAGESDPRTDLPMLARLIEATLRGSFLGWALYRDGSAAEWLRKDVDAVLRASRKRGGPR